MAHSWPKVLEIFAADAKLSAELRKVYDGVMSQDASHAVISFERSPVTRSPFDAPAR